MELSLSVHGPAGCRVLIEPRGVPRHVVSLKVSPVLSVAPFTASVYIAALKTAAAGVYLFSLSLRSVDSGEIVGELVLKLMILPGELGREQYEELKIIYRYYGIQLALWQALKTIYPQGAVFSTIRVLYEIIVGSGVSKGTVGNILRILSMKKLVEKAGDGFYKPIEVSIEEALRRVDVKRHRGGNTSDQPGSTKYIEEAELEELPGEVLKAYSVATTICRVHGPLPALYFMLHTLLGARKTGFLLLWNGPWFIICEPKTNFCHHYYSAVLLNMLLSLGLQPGVYYSLSQEHENARKTAEKYIHEYFNGYREARRLHYMLREQGYIGQLDQKPYVLRIYQYADNTVGVKVYDYTGRELEFEANVHNKPLLDVETWIALPVMHVSSRNEETYYDFK
ncbi:MAG: hypothetical protein QXU26_04335 [Thermofilaceae archaeon]